MQKNRSVLCQVWKFIVVFLQTLSVFIVSADQLSEAYAEQEPLKVGVILPLSGEFAVPGDACKNGVLLAASELKDANVPLKLLIQDSPSAGAKTSLTAYQKLRSIDRVDVFLGLLSPEELAAVGPPAERDGTALVAFVASKDRPKNSLLIWMSPEVEAKRLAQEVYKKQQNVAILSADQQWEKEVSDAFSEEFTRLGGKISLRIESPYSSKDVSTPALKVKQTAAQAVVIPPYSLFSSYAKALHKVGITLPIYSIELDQAAIDDTQGTAENAVVIRPADPDDKFSRKYAEYYHGRSADIPASQCYDGTKIIGDAARSGARSGREFARYFEKLKQYEGASGPIVFESTGTIFNTEFMVVAGGKLTRAASQG